MPNSDGLKPWIIQFVIFLLTIIAAAIAAPIWIEARIDTNVKSEAEVRRVEDIREAQVRATADARIEARQTEDRNEQRDQLKQINDKLTNIENYIRDLNK